MAKNKNLTAEATENTEKTREKDVFSVTFVFSVVHNFCPDVKIGKSIASQERNTMQNQPPNLYKEIIDQFVSSMQSKARRLRQPDQMIGCTDDEIAEVMKGQNVHRLPEIYLQLLKRLGKQPGDLFRGESFEYFYLPTLKEDAQSSLDEANVNYTLLDNHFVFFMHNTHAFMYFDMSSEDLDNPPVYGWLEGESPSLAHPSFSDFLDSCVDFYVNLRR